MHTITCSCKTDVHCLSSYSVFHVLEDFPSVPDIHESTLGDFPLHIVSALTDLQFNHSLKSLSLESYVMPLDLVPVNKNKLTLCVNDLPSFCSWALLHIRNRPTESPNEPRTSNHSQDCIKLTHGHVTT